MCVSSHLHDNDESHLSSQDVPEMHGVRVLPLMARRVTVVAVSAERRQDSVGRDTVTTELLRCQSAETKASKAGVSRAPAGGGGGVIEPVVMFLRHVPLGDVRDVVD